MVPARGVEAPTGLQPRFAQKIVGLLVVAGSVIGALSFLVHGVLRDGLLLVLYAVALTFCFVVGLVLLTTRRVSPYSIPALVALGDAVHVALSFSVGESQLYSMPLSMLIITLTAACFLHRKGVALQAAAGYPISWITLGQTRMHGAELALQVFAAGTMLALAAVVVFAFRRRAERLLDTTRQLSTTDPLTGLANRRMLETTAPALWERAGRSELMLAALVLDLDRFKAINDKYGHSVGDAILCQVAEAVEGVVRSDDVVARIGGEEMVVLTLVPGPHAALALAERIRAALAAATTDLPVTTSIGAATSAPRRDMPPVDALWHVVGLADTAMYDAKSQGRDRSVLYSTALHAPATVD